MKRIITITALGLTGVALAGVAAWGITAGERAYWQGADERAEYARDLINPEEVAADPVDLHGDAPRCTDLIADAGGVCWGEPLPPCAMEDSDNCYWDAATMGNGIGRSFIVVDDVVTYTDGAGE